MKGLPRRPRQLSSFADTRGCREANISPVFDFRWFMTIILRRYCWHLRIMTIWSG
jgi:hypothetical protein